MITVIHTGWCYIISIFTVHVSQPQTGCGEYIEVKIDLAAYEQRARQVVNPFLPPCFEHGGEVDPVTITISLFFYAIYNPAM